MSDRDPSRSLYYPVVLIPGRSGSGRPRPGPFRWLAPSDHPRQCDEAIAEAMARGASMGFVVRFRSDEVRVLVNHTKPAAVRTVIEMYLMLAELIEREHPSS